MGSVVKKPVITVIGTHVERDPDASWGSRRQVVDVRTCTDGKVSIGEMAYDPADLRLALDELAPRPSWKFRR